MTKYSRSSIVTTVVLLILFSVVAGLIFNATRESEVKKAAVSQKTDIDLELDTKRDKKSKDIDFGPYMTQLQKRIKGSWFPPKGNESKSVEVVFKVYRNGTMSNLRMTRTSGLAIADQAALKAVKIAAPFGPLPKGAPEFVDIDFSFDYNVHKKNKK